MKRDLCELENSTFDLLVVGGGIYGAFAFCLGAFAGLKVALIEQRDFGHATSANSQKILHGGLRYLQSMDLPRLWQSMKERNRLMWLAPHLVRPLKCTMPLYGHGTKGREALAAGTSIYNLITNCFHRTTIHGVRLPSAGIIGKEEFLEIFPEVEQDRLVGAAIWYEGICENTERLVLAFIKSAHKLGGVAANYTKATRFMELSEGVILVSVKDTLSSQSLEIRAKSVINCTGPWCDETQKRTQGTVRVPAHHFAAGLNLITKPIFESQSAIGLISPTSEDSRLFFVVPWKGRSIIGTEWFHVNTPIDQFNLKKESCTNFLDKFNIAYPPANLSLQDVSYVHWGFVPCRKPGAQSNEMPVLSKKFQIHNDCKLARGRIVNVIGVKYTTAGDVAQKVLKIVNPGIKHNFNIDFRLMGGEIDNFSKYKSEIMRKWLGKLDTGDIERLLINYGTEFDSVLSSANQSMTENHGAVLPIDEILKAETLFAVRQEMAQKLSDVIFRRTDRGTAGIPDHSDLINIGRIMGGELGWSEAKVEAEIAGVKTAYPHFLLNDSNY